MQGRAIEPATVDRLSVATDRGHECLLPPSVAEEGIVPAQPDARRIEAGDLAVRDAPATDVRERLADNDALSPADADVLALAHAVHGVAVMDELYGRDVAAAGGIPTTGTAALVIDAVRSGDIPAASRRETLDELVEAGWYCSPPLYARIRRRLEDCGPHTEGKPNAYPDEARPSQPSFALVGVTDRWVGRELDEGSSGSYRTLSPGGSRSARWHCPAVRTDPTSLACGSGSARRSARTTAGTSP